MTVATVVTAVLVIAALAGIALLVANVRWRVQDQRLEKPSFDVEIAVIHSSKNGKWIVQYIEVKAKNTCRREVPLAEARRYSWAPPADLSLCRRR